METSMVREVDVGELMWGLATGKQSQTELLSKAVPLNHSEF
jgi:hypothetical protein